MSTLTAYLPRRWQDQAILALGVFLFFSPWLLGYVNSDAASWNAWVVGLIFIAGGAIAAIHEPYWPEFVISFMGFWLFLAPRILAFTDHVLATGLLMVTGAVVAVLALWSAIVAAHAEIAAAAAASPIEPPAGPPSRPPVRKAA